MTKLLPPYPTEAPHEIWLWLAEWFLPRCLKSVDDGQTDANRWMTDVCLYYKLTHEPKGSGELKMYYKLKMSNDSSKIFNSKVFSTRMGSNIWNMSRDMTKPTKFCLCWGLTSQSTIFQSCRDGATASWVINQYFRGVKCLAQGHNTAAVGLEQNQQSDWAPSEDSDQPGHPPRLIRFFAVCMKKP